jgi:hypothetical protein
MKLENIQYNQKVICLDISWCPTLDGQAFCILNNHYILLALQTSDVTNYHYYSATNFCADDPCGQHLCTNTQSGFLCTCSGGFMGTRCELPPDNCEVNECQNDATCLSGSHNYTCLCKPGYRGIFCQTPPSNKNIISSSKLLYFE